LFYNVFYHYCQGNIHIDKEEKGEHNIPMIKYFIYCRKSTEEEERQVLSIEAQLTELREYAKREGLFIVKEFTENQTAKEPGRWRILKIKGAFSQRLGRIGSLNMSQSIMPFFDQ
jgi:hypothetical protein